MYDSELVMDLASSVHQILGLLMVLRTSLGSNFGPDHATTTINQLLRPGCLQWNEELISTLFNTRDRESILKSRNIRSKVATVPCRMNLWMTVLAFGNVFGKFMFRRR